MEIRSLIRRSASPYVEVITKTLSWLFRLLAIANDFAEEEISELDDEDKKEFLEAIGLTESGVDKLTRAAYHLLGLGTYFTAGEKEVRAWTFKRGMKAPQAAGIIHSDFENARLQLLKKSFLETILKILPLGNHLLKMDKPYQYPG